jgi:nitrate reductase beta subunit
MASEDPTQVSRLCYKCLCQLCSLAQKPVDMYKKGERGWVCVWRERERGERERAKER